MASWESKSKKKKGTHHGIDLEDVTEMVLRRFMILGNVGKVSEIVSILTGPVDIADFVLADGLLSGGNDRREIQLGGTKNKKNKTIVVFQMQWRAWHRPSMRVVVGKRASVRGHTLYLRSTHIIAIGRCIQYLIMRVEKLDAADGNGQNNTGCPSATFFRFLLLQFLDGSFGRFGSADVPYQRRAQILVTKD